MYAHAQSATPISGQDIPSGLSGLAGLSQVPVYRDFSRRLGHPWADQASLVKPAFLAFSSNGKAFVLSRRFAWQVFSQALTCLVTLPYLRQDSLASGTESAWAQSPTIAQAIAADWVSQHSLYIGNASVWANSSEPYANAIRQGWISQASIAISRALAHTDAPPPIGQQTRIVWGLARFQGRAVRLPWGNARFPLWHIDLPPGGGGTGGGGTDGYPDYFGTWKIYYRRSYSMLHDISLVRLPERTPIDARSIGFTLSADSPHIEFRAVLSGPQALELCLPGEDGITVLEASIDGLVAQFVLDPPRVSARFKDVQRSISGRSLSWYLGHPYLSPTDRTSEADASIQQLALAELPYGWSLTWDSSLPDHTVPAGAWSARSATPIQAIQRLAQAIGAIVIPDLDAKHLTIRPRYTVMPWDYVGSTPWMEIPESALLDVELEYTPPLYANAVYVYGGNVGGIMARCKLSGTAGDRVLPPIQDLLMTDSQAAYARAQRALAGQWQQPLIKVFSIPFDNTNFPFIELGKLIRLETDYGTINGCVSSVQLDARLTPSSAGRTLCHIKQRVAIGEDSGDALQRYVSLSPDTPILWGTVTAQHADGTVTILDASGVSHRVQGAATNGSTVFFTTRILSSAPSYTPVFLDL